jgi:hypothetical protein
MNMFKKWMTLLLSVVALGLSGCGGGGDQPFYDSGTAPVEAVDPGAGSYSLTAAASSTSIVVGTTAQISAWLLLEGVPVVGAPVTFTVDNGRFSGSTTITVTTDAAGLATATLTAPLAVGSGTVAVTAAGKSASVSMKYLVGPVVNIILEASPTAVGISSQSTLTAAVYDQYYNPVANEMMKFEVTTLASGLPTISLGGLATTNASGIATAVYTSGTTTGVTDVISVAQAISPSVTATTNIAVLASATTISSLSLGLSIPSTAITVGTNTVTADATVLDDTGAAVEGVDVAFYIEGSGVFGGAKYAIVKTNTFGIASATLTAPLLVGSATITAATPGKSASIGVTYIPDVPRYVTLTASPATVGVSSDSTLTAALYDQYGNVAPNEAVTFSFATAGNDSGGLLSNPVGSAQTDASGIATMIYTSGITVDVTDTLQVKATNGSQPVATVDIAVSAAATSIATLDLALSSPTTAITVGTTTVTANATVLDSLGDPVVGVSVAFQIVGGGDFGGAKSVTANTIASGVASVTLTAPQLVGSATITVSSAGLSDSVTVTYIPDVPSQVTLSATPSTVGVNSTSTLSATVYDKYGNVTPDQEVAFAITVAASVNPYLTPNLGGTKLTGVASTDSSGVATIVYTSGGTLPAVDPFDTITADPINGAVAPATVNVNLSASSAAIGKITVAAGSASIVADGTSTTTIRAQLLDTANAPMAGAVITFTTTAGVFVEGPNAKTATATTDADGYAIVTLESSINGSTPTSTGTAAITATVSGYSASTTVEFTAGTVTQILMYVSPSTLPTGSEFSFEAVVMDANNNRISDERVQFLLLKEGDFLGFPGVYDVVVNSYEDYTDDTGIIRNSFGVFDVYALDAGATTLQLKATTTNGTVKTSIITIDDAAATIGALTLVPANTAIVADGVTQTSVRATVTDTANNPVMGAAVSFTTSAGLLLPGDVTTLSASTNASGVAEVFLKSTTNLAQATLTASISGFNATAVVDFVAGTADPLNSSITVSPSTLPADGTTTATVTVTLADANNNPVSDGTSVTLFGIMSDAAITSANPSSTATGRATFILRAATTSAVDSLYLGENASITGSVTYGATGTGEPANIQVTSAYSQIYVSGVGQNENTSITVSVVDEGGSLIANPSADNLRITLLTKPNGGEYISGESFAGTTDTSVVDNLIEIATSAGQAVFNLQSGTLPGIVEIKVETIGYAVNPAAIVPQIVISSGAAHSINLTSPYTDSIVKLGGGVYKRVGTAIVSDRYGNAVPDGTVVNFGMLDTIIAQDSDGATTTAASTMTDGNASLDTANVTRNGVLRFIQENDRVLLGNAAAEDKSRHVATIAATAVTVQKPYVKTASALNYVIGASTLGGQIVGVDHAGTGGEVVGYGTTVDGQVTFYVKYPANGQTVHLGCGIGGFACSDPAYQTNDAIIGCTANGGTWGLYRDERYVPDSSAEVYVVASTSESTIDSAVTVDAGQFCFASIAGWSLTASHDKLSGSASVTFWLVDGGDLIPIPFTTITPTVVVEKNSAGTCSDLTYTTKDDCIAPKGTWTPGSCSDGVSTDQVTCEAVPAIWTAGSCSDGVSATQLICEGPRGVWTTLPLVDTTNLSCITDNPGSFVAGQSVTGSCSATVTVGENAATGDKATITWRAGDASVSIPLTIP